MSHAIWKGSGCQKLATFAKSLPRRGAELTKCHNTSLDVPTAKATVVALAFRGLTFWLPLAIGFLLLRRVKSFGAEEQPQTGGWSVRAVALLAALMGVINVLSAITPTLVNRLVLLERVSPLEVRHGSHLTAALAGFALLVLAGNLWRRKRVAWLLAMVVLVISSVSHLLKGLDYEEATLAAALAVWLWFLRPHFHARSDPPSIQQGLQALAAALLFTLAGGAHKSLRSAVNRLTKLGHRAELHEPPLPDSLLRELRAISDEWLAMIEGRELRFSLGWFDDDYVRSSPVMAVHTPEGAISAFANLVPEYQRNEATIDIMRHRRDVEHGTMDFLFVALFQWAQERGYATFNLGLSALSGVGERADDPTVERALHYIYEHVNQFYNYKGLHAFKAKFDPQWSSRYLAYPGPASLPSRSPWSVPTRAMRSYGTISGIGLRNGADVVSAPRMSTLQRGETWLKGDSNANHPTHIERHFTATETVCDVVIGMSDGLTVPFALAAVMLVVSKLACSLEAVPPLRRRRHPQPRPPASLDDWKHRARLRCWWRPIIPCPTTRLGYERREK